MRPLRVSFSGAGFLGAWHLGVGDAFAQRGLLDTLEIAGASAGALVGVVLCSGTPVGVARHHLSQLSARTREQPLGILTPGFSLVDHLREALCADLPSDAHQRASGKLHVALTSLRPDELGRTRHVNAFGSRDELIDCVVASSDIPGVTGHLRASHEAAAMQAALTGDAKELPSEQMLLQRWLRRRDIGVLARGRTTTSCAAPATDAPLRSDARRRRPVRHLP